MKKKTLGNCISSSTQLHVSKNKKNMSTLNLEKVTMCQDVISRIQAILKGETFPALESTDLGFIIALDKLVSIIKPLEVVRTPGGFYYTITKIGDRPSVISSIDDGRVIDSERFEKKLYFNNLADAELTLARMIIGL